MRWTTIIVAVMTLVAFNLKPGWGHRDSFTKEQREQLANIKTVLVEAVALTDKGAQDAGPFREVVEKRLAELGFAHVADPKEPHDAVVRVKCEQRKTWEGTTAAGGDNDLPGAPSRLWKGPACQLTYRLGALKVQWQKEVRTPFSDAVEAAQRVNAPDPGAYALSELKTLLEEYDFPVLLAAEWGQGDRLLKLLDSSSTPQPRKLLVLSVLGDMMASEDALPHLKEALKDKDLSKEAAVALGSIGSDGIPVLAEILKSSNQPELQAAAAKGLGRIGGISGDPRVVDPLLSMLEAPGIDIRVQTEIVWALGKVPDKRSLPPLKALFKKVLHIRDPENKALKNLKEALNWSTKQLDMDEHLS